VKIEYWHSRNMRIRVPRHSDKEDKIGSDLVRDLNAVNVARTDVVETYCHRITEYFR